MTSKFESMSEAELRSYAAASDASLSHFQERMGELELALDDKEWTRISLETEREFSREGQNTINKLSRYFFLKNPLIKRAVLTQSNYVFGKGIDVMAADGESEEATIINDFMEDPENRRELTSHESMMMKENELQLFGNIFFFLYTNPVTKNVTIRSIPYDEITDIIMHPDDAKRPLYYKREWQAQTMNLDTGIYETQKKTEYFLDWRVSRNSLYGRRSSIGRDPVRKNAVIYHVATNQLSDMKFGVSEMYAALDWARAYKEFLENWATITKAHARFAWQLSPAGGKKGAQQAQHKMNQMSGGQGGANERVTASTFVAGNGTKMEPMKTAGAQPSAEDGQQMIHMVSAATGIFYHYLVGDPSTGNLATAKSMERPMELQFTNRQKLWRDVFKNIIYFAIQQKRPGSDAETDVTFPNLLEHSTKDMIEAIVSASTLNGSTAAGTIPLRKVTELLLKELGEENIEDSLNEWFPEGEEMSSQGTQAQNADDLVQEAVKELREAVNHLAEDHNRTG